MQEGLNPEATAELLLDIAEAVGVELTPEMLEGLAAESRLDLEDWAAPDTGAGGAEAVRLKLEVPLALRVASNGGPVEEQSVDSLLIGRPRAKDLDALTQAGKRESVGMRRALLGILKREPDQARLQMEHVDNLDAADLMRAMQVVTDFLPKRRSRKTGGRSPAS